MINKHLHKFFLIPIFFISVLLLLSSITACICSTVEKGQKVSVYLVFKEDVNNTTNSSIGFNEKTFYSHQNLEKAQNQQKIATYQINSLKKIFTVANHRWFFSKNPDYTTTEFYKQLNQENSPNSTPMEKTQQKNTKEFLKDYLSKKNNFFKHILVFLDNWDKNDGLVVYKKYSYIKEFLFSQSQKEDKNASTTKSFALPEVVFQFTNRWRIFLQISNITLKIAKQSFTVNDQIYYQSSFKSLKDAKLKIVKIVDLNS